MSLCVAIAARVSTLTALLTGWARNISPIIGKVLNATGIHAASGGLMGWPLHPKQVTYNPLHGEGEPIVVAYNPDDDTKAQADEDRGIELLSAGKLANVEYVFDIQNGADDD